MLVISHPMGLQPAIGEVRDPAIGILLNMERAGREVEVDQGHHPQKKAAAALACCLSWP
jgi:transcription initiation factor TFIIIB Brf1 subunit/transcription initiation factor TFIIB